MSGILRLESLTKGNTLRQGDLTLLKYRLFDADGDKLDISGKSATVRLMKNNFTFIAYEKEGLTVAPDDTISFSVNKILPAGLYHLEVIVDGQYIFPSRDDEGKINIDKSSFGADITIVEATGVEAVARKATGMMKQDEEFIDDMIANVISDTNVGNIEEYYNQFNEAIVEFTDLKPKAVSAITKSDEALTKSQSTLNVANGIDAKATNALSLSESADTLSKSVQEQFNQVVIDGDSSVESAQARVNADGETYPTLKARLDEEHTKVATQLDNMPAVNVKNFGAMGDGVTDDTQSVKDAIAYACTFAKGTGWKTQVPNISFPAGEYLISEPQALNPTVSALSGFNIVGEGYMNTRIRYTYVGNGPDDYLMLNGGKSWWGFSYVENIAFIGNGDNNIWAIKSQQGSPQANRFSRVHFGNVKDCVSVLYGSANANADLFRFETCKASQIYGWVFGVAGNLNSQAINHAFVNCDFETIYGTILHFRSGGDVMIYGGSWIVNTNGRVIDCVDGSGAGIGRGNRFFTFIGTKFEWQASASRSGDDTFPLSYSNSLASIKFIRCNFGQFTNSISTPHVFSSVERGELTFDDCYITNNMRVKLRKGDSANHGFDVPHLLVANSHMGVELANFAIVDITGGGNNNKAWNPIVEAINCSLGQGETRLPADVSLNRQNGAKGLTTSKKMYQYFHGVNHQQGLPRDRKTFKLPIGSTLTKIYLVAGKSTNGYRYKYTIKNFDETKTLLTAEFLNTSSDKQFISEDLYLYLANDAEREIVIDVETTASTDRQGYIDFEYI